LETVEIQADPREIQKKRAARRLRRNGKIPAILYGPKTAPVSLELNKKDFSTRVAGLEGSHLVRLKSPADALANKVALVKDLQYHPVTGEVMHAETIAIGGTGLLFLPPLLMILFREKYPRWWYDWNLELLRFSNRVGTYLALMNDRYPSTDERQWVHLDFPYPDAKRDLNRWLPLVKWLLAIPHYIVLAVLYLAVVVVVIVAWFAILFTGRYPRGIFDFVEGVIRWHNRVVGYAFILVTDRYPPFSLRQPDTAPPTPERPPQSQP
jgi:ribosomal protein L25 (general stress protein Ctc)